MTDLGFITIPDLPAVFVKFVGNKMILAGIFVDDGEGYSNDADLAAWFLARVRSRWKAKLFGRVWSYLGMEHEYDDHADTTTLRPQRDDGRLRRLPRPAAADCHLRRGQSVRLGHVLAGLLLSAGRGGILLSETVKCTR